MKPNHRYLTVHWFVVFGLALGLSLSSSTPAWAMQDQAAAIPTSTIGQGIPAYPISGLEFSYVKPLSGLPDPATFLDIDVDVAKVIDGWVGPDREGEKTTLPIGQLFETGTVTVYPSALRAICGAIAGAYPNLLLTVGPDEQDIDPSTRADLRPASRTSLKVKVAFEGPSYEVSQFDLHYAIGDWPTQVPVSQIIDNVSVMLTPTEGGFVTWLPGVEPVEYRLSSLDGGGTVRFSAIAVQLILEGIRDYLIGEDLMGVWTRPAPGELEANLADARQGRTVFHIEIITGYVSSVRTVARGDRVPADESIDNPIHERIKRNSPVQPSTRDALSPDSVLHRDVLDDYLYRMSRHPGRRVDVAVAPGVDPFSISLDYHITENKPLLLYAQASNTGTRQTDDWRYRFGLFDNQLTGNDDILGLEFVTADFDVNNSFNGSYEAKFDVNDETWRYRLTGSWGKFEASEVGFANARFTGESWSAGAEVVRNVYQKKQFFVDLVAGIRFVSIEVNNIFALVDADEDFILPYVGLRMERNKVETTSNAFVSFEFNPNLTNVDQSDLNGMGRLFPDEDWYILRWDLQHTLYMEPWLNHEAWRDISTPESSTLAHELAFRFRGQYSFEKRLIPQMEMTAGGFYSVRGYPESVAVGDTVLLVTAEYRYHIPRSFGIDETPIELFNEPFRVVPQHAYGVADWDLIFRTFLDMGRTFNTDRLTNVDEQHETLIGAGIGLEFVFKTNLNVRVDWGFALEDIEGKVSAGSSQVHIVSSIFF